MARHGWLAAMCVLAGFLVGCAQDLGRSRVLGEVGYGTAFATARDVMAQYYSIESSDASTGEILGRPKRVQMRGERLLGGSPARQVARLHLRRDGKQVVAHLAIAVQRQGSAVYRQYSSIDETYSSVPNQTPAEADAATTPEQNEAWRTVKHDRALEQKILGQIHRALHPQAK